MKRLTLTLLNLSISILALGQAIQIEMDNYTAVPSESFCLAFEVSNFEQIVSSQYTVQWDPAVLSFESLINVGLPSPGNLFYNTAFINQGQLLINWFDSFGNGNDLPDETIMYELCFMAVGPVGSSTTLEFTNLPLQIEVTNTTSGGMDIGIDPSGGTVTIVDPLEISSANLSHPDCDTPNEGSIDISVSGGTSPYNYSWSGPNNYSSSLEDIGNLVSGMYYLTITDSSLPPLTLTDSFEIESNVSIPLVLVAPGGVITCSDTLITLDASGSSEGFNYQIFWLTSNGNIILNGNTLNPVVNAPGDYQLIITNTDSGCSATAMTTVTQDSVAPTVNAGMDGILNCSFTETDLDGSNSSTGPEFSPLWSTQDGNILNGQNTSVATVNGGGTYTLIVIDNTNGCSAEDEVIVTIDTISPLAEAGMNQTQECFSSLVSLDASTSSTGSNISYQWFTIDGNIVAGDTSTNPDVDAAGDYQLLVSNLDNGCTATDWVTVELNQALEEANAGTDENICEDIFMLSANLPNSNTGVWTYTGSAQIENLTSNNTLVNNLPGGINEFVWTLSTDECSNYSSDTILLTVEAEPIANDDQFTIPFGSNPYMLDLVANDGVLTLTDFEVSILDSPMTGTLDEITAGQFEYNYPANFFGPLEFEYTICNIFCPDYCDTALVMLNVLNEIRIDTTVEITNAFTPNDDGVNDTFIIPVLENNPEAYPDNEIIFFNRWGNIVHQAKPYLNDWRGTNSSGKKLPQGTYYYVLRLDIGQGEIIKGDVTILR